MNWKKTVCTANTIVRNDTCRIKKIILEHSSATTAVIYDEADGSATAGNKVWTLRNTTTVLSDEIDFGEEGIQFTYGCYIDWNAGSVLVIHS